MKKISDSLELDSDAAMEMVIQQELQDISDKIYDYIAVVHPDAEYSQDQVESFISPDVEVVENSIEEDEQYILESYFPADEAESDDDNPIPVELITYQQTIQCHEILA